MENYDIEKYALKNGHKECLFGWYISNLKIYDKPKTLNEFGITRAPQSWCYV